MNTPNLRFPEFSGEWEEINLQDAGVQIIDGDRGENYPNGDDFSDYGFCLFLNAKNVTSSGFSFNECSFIDAEKDKQLRKGKLVKSDLVLTTRGTIGNVAYYDKSVKYEHIRINSGMVLLRTSKSKILPDYLYKFTNSRQFFNQVIRISFGSAQPQLTVSEIAKLKLTVPKKPEQQKIASFLTAVDERIGAMQKKVVLLKKYKKGAMQKIFSQEIRFRPARQSPDGSSRMAGGDESGKEYPEWGKEKLGDIARIKTGNLNVQDANVDGKYVFFDRSENIKRYDDYTFDNEALIYAGEGSQFLPRYFKGKYGLHQRSYAISDTHGIDMKFLFYYMSTQNNHFLKYAVGTTAMSLRMDCFNKCVVLIPLEEEQQKIAAFLTAIDDKIALEERRLAEAKRFKKSLLQQMFV